MFPVPCFYLKPTKSSKVKGIADSSPNSLLGWPACSGSKQTDITVTALCLSPVQQVGAVSQLPPSALHILKLTAIRQVPFTDHSGAAWIEVDGSGNCIGQASAIFSVD